MLWSVDLALGQQPGKVFGPARVTEPWEAFVFTEPVLNSDIPVDITLLETMDGLFTPTSFRLRDRVHLKDMDSVGLITTEIETGLLTHLTP